MWAGNKGRAIKVMRPKTQSVGRAEAGQSQYGASDVDDVGSPETVPFGRGEHPIPAARKCFVVYLAVASFTDCKN